MTEKVRLQHYVPRVYLKNFSKYNGKKYYLWVFDKKTEKIFQTNIENIAVEEEFYDKVEEDQITEEFLCDIETKFSISVSNLITSKDLSKLGREDFENISEFIAIQMLRTKETRLEVEEAARKFLKKFDNNLSDNLRKEVEDTLKKESLREGHRKSIIQHMDNFKKIIKEMKWILVSNKSKFPYWISDNPVAEYNSKKNSGLISVGAEIYFPITSKLCLIICDPISFQLEPNKRLTRDYRNIVLERDLQVRYSTRFVFSEENNFTLAKIMIKEDPSLKDEHRSRVKVM